MPYHPPVPDPRQPKGSGLVSALIQAEKLVQIALVLPCAAFIGWLIGDWLGGRFHLPLLGALGAAFGGAAGLVYVVRLAMDAAKDPANADKNDPGQKGASGKSGSGKPL